MSPLSLNIKLKRLSYFDYRVLLRVDEGLEDDPDGHVDVVLVHVLPQVHLGVGFRQADHALDVPHGDTAYKIIEIYSQLLSFLGSSGHTYDL